MEHNKTSNPAGQWLDTAVAKIRFGPDRKEVRAELEAHLEDKALDFQRIFPGLTQEEAQDRAAAGEIALTLEEIEPWSDILRWTVPEREVFSAQAAREGDWFFFELPPHQDHPDSEWCIMDALWYNVSFSQGAGSWPYRLTLRDAKGDVVWTGSGDTEEGNAGLRART